MFRDRVKLANWWPPNIPNPNTLHLLAYRPVVVTVVAPPLSLSRFLSLSLSLSLCLLFWEWTSFVKGLPVTHVSQGASTRLGPLKLKLLSAELIGQALRVRSGDWVATSSRFSTLRPPPPPPFTFRAQCSLAQFAQLSPTALGLMTGSVLAHLPFSSAAFSGTLGGGGGVYVPVAYGYVPFMAQSSWDLLGYPLGSDNADSPLTCQSCCRHSSTNQDRQQYQHHPLL